MAAVRSRATKAATTPGLSKPQPQLPRKIGEIMPPAKKPRIGPVHDTMFEILISLDWLFEEIDDQSIVASPVQRAALVSAQKNAQAIYDSNW